MMPTCVRIFFSRRCSRRLYRRHLADRTAVQRLLAAAASILAPGGVLALGYRDYSGPPRTGLDRFIPVRHDAHRALVCCIDAVDAEHVSVTDLVTTVTLDGLRTQIGSYLKLRLAPAAVVAWAAAAGLRFDRSATDAGQLVQIFRAPT